MSTGKSAVNPYLSFGKEYVISAVVEGIRVLGQRKGEFSLMIILLK